MTNVRMLSTAAAVGMLISLLLGVGVVRIVGRRRAFSSDAPPYIALHV